LGLSKEYNGKMSLKTFSRTILVEIFLGYSDKHSGIMAQLYVFEN
jgi:hypothetical protein